MRQSVEQAAQVIAGRYETPPQAYIQTFGCQQNMNDSEKIRGVLSQLGYSFLDGPEGADLILFNTCAVREHAEQRVFGNIGALKKQKEGNPGLIIGLCGCMVQQQSVVDKIRASYPFVDLVFGVNAIDKLPELLTRQIESKKKVILDPAPVLNEIHEEVPTRRDSSFRAWLPIMYGCDNFCSYCIVPYVRGRERSRSPQAVEAEFRSLVAEGYKDITLLGQNVNSYGKNLDEPCDFADLLARLCAVPGDYRVRFMTSHPKDITHKLIDTMAAYPQICHHLHLPVQAGNDRILEQMNRRYTSAYYFSLIDYAREKMPDIALSSDIIVGFPGETEQEFLDTVALVKRVRYMQLFTFIYSKRTGTKAAELPDDTPHAEKAKRLNYLTAVQEEIGSELMQALVGTRVRVLAEGRGRDGVCWAGRLANNALAEFDGPQGVDLTGKFVTVDIVSARKTLLQGKLAPEWDKPGQD